MVTIQVSLPEPPGERGRKVEHWRTRPRHTVVATLMLFTALTMGVAGWFDWRPESRGTAVFILAMASTVALLAAAVWRRGARLRRGQRHLMRTAASNRRKLL
jgi:hypothetical protein